MSWDAPPPGEQPPPQQPYGEAAPYGQPTAPYGDQWGQYASGPYFPTYPQQKRGRNWFYIGLGVVGVVVAVGVAIGVAATSSSSGGTPSAAGSSGTSTPTTTASGSASPSASAAPPQGSHTVIVPVNAGPLNLLENDDTSQRIASIESNLNGNNAYANPQIGFYTVGSDDDFSVWMLAETTTNVPIIHNSVRTLGDAAMAHQIALGAKMTDVKTEAPGPLGGALLCGKLPLDGTQYRVCEWVDDSTFGWVYFKPSVRQADVLPYALDLRQAAEQ